MYCGLSTLCHQGTDISGWIGNGIGEGSCRTTMGSSHNDNVSGGEMVDMLFAPEMSTSKPFVDETAAVEKSIIVTYVRALL